MPNTFFIQLTRNNEKKAWYNVAYLQSFGELDTTNIGEAYKACKSVLCFSTEDSYDYVLETPEEIIKLLNLANQN